MRALIVLSTLALALVATGTAGAGGWASVGIAPLPDGTESGGTWRTEITVLQHGRTPLEGLAPVVRITGDDGASHEFLAMPTEKPGVYDASVVFPASGDWRIAVESGFGDSRLTYGPVSITSPSGGEGIRPVPTAWLVALVSSLALASLLVLGTRRLRRFAPASR
jgi:hypothetical protein